MATTWKALDSRCFKIWGGGRCSKLRSVLGVENLGFRLCVCVYLSIHLYIYIYIHTYIYIYVYCRLAPSMSPVEGARYLIKSPLSARAVSLGPGDLDMGFRIKV